MAKRTPLSFNSNQLTDDLKQSAGRGVDAFFSSPVPPSTSEAEGPPLSNPETFEDAPLTSDTPAGEEPRSTIVSIKDGKKAKRPGNMTRNITILHLDEVDIARLREATDRVQTYRLTRHEIEWMKDTAYRLSKEVKRGKVAQADILRIAVILFENYLATHKDELIEILERIK